MKNLAKAVINVMRAVKGIEKNSKVGSGNSSYDGVMDKDVKEAFKKAFIDNGLCLFPIDVDETTEIDSWIDPQYKKRKQSVFTKVTTKYLLLHESGESTTICGYGHGVDSQDKGAGKATTYALKYCLLNTFLTPTGKIDDTDTTHSDEIEVPEKLKAYPPKNYNKAAKSIHEGKCTFEDIQEKYSLSAAAKKTINSIIKEISKNG